MTNILPGQTARWYTAHGWHYGRIVKVGYKLAHIERMGRTIRVPVEKVYTQPTVTQAGRKTQ